MINFIEVAHITSEEYFKKGGSFSLDVYKGKYPLDEIEAQFPAKLFWRLAKTAASYEATPELQAYWANRWFEELWLGYWRPAGSIMSGLGSDKKISISNCTYIHLQEDTLESIFETGYKIAKAAAYRQGMGTDFSHLRPKGAIITNSAKISTGAVHWMDFINNIGNYVGQNSRIPALLFSLNVKHPDVLEFITAKSNQHMIPNANISIQITDDFMRAYEEDKDWELSFYVDSNKEKISKIVKAKKLMEMLAKEAHGFAEPGVQFIDTCKRESMTDTVGFNILGSNACCLAEETVISTKQGHFLIKDLVGKNVEIWDGTDWKNVDNFDITNTNQPMLKITLQDGSFERMTYEHNIILDSGKKIKAKDLKIGDKLQPSSIPLIAEGKNEPGAYAKGFLIGDGTLTNIENPTLQLYNTKYKCFKKLKQSLAELETEHLYYTGTTVTNISLSKEYTNKKVVRGLTQFKTQLVPWCSTYKTRLPQEIFNWNISSKFEFVSGIFDADGTAQNTSKAYMYQISSISEGLLLDLQKLLKTMGIYSKVSLSINRKKSIFRSGTYLSKPLYRLTVSQINSLKLSKHAKFKRLKLLTNKTPKHIFSNKFNTVVEIRDDGIDENVYCCTVDSTHSFSLTSGIQIGNSEKFMTPDSTCVLASLNVGMFPFEGYEPLVVKIAKSMVRFLDNCVQYELDEKKTPYPNQHYVVSQLREIGIGITNLNGWLIKKNLPYDSEDGMQAMIKFIKTLSIESWNETINLGKEKGNALAFQAMLDKTGDNSFIYQSAFAKRLRDEAGMDITHCRNLNVMSIAPTGSLSMVFPNEVPESTGIEPFSGFYWWKRTRISGKWEWYFVIPEFVRQKLIAEGYSDVPTSVYDNDGAVGTKWVEMINKYFDPTVFKPAHYIDPLKKVEFMSEVAKWVDSSISVTYNLREDVDIDTVEKIYYYGWKKGVKSISVYRDKSRQGVIEFESPKLVEKRFSTKEVRPTSIQIHPAAFRPKELPCQVHRATIKGNKYIVLVGLLDNLPYEVYLADEDSLDLTARMSEGVIAKFGSGKYNLISKDKVIIKDISTHINNHEYENLTRMISLSLRTGAPVDYIVEQLEKSKGTIVDASQAIARTLKKYIGEYYRKGTCSNCGSDNVEYKEGCGLCLDCGFSKCS